MFKGLLPSSVAVCHATPEMWETKVKPDEEARIVKAVDKRKREFRAGRHAKKSWIKTLISSAILIGIGYGLAIIMGQPTDPNISLTD
ncbi:MAG: hypothetical protein JKY67_14365, partial [Pseudomonadales bacterium]|nr:hypothetical protein [Pseudomonadales bacterium]